jgi:hypothetical protein
LCVPLIGRASERFCQLVQLHLVGVLLSRVRMRMTHQCLKRDHIAAALAKEAVGESVSKLVRGEEPNLGSLADAPDHPHERLITRRLLGVFSPPRPPVVRHPLLDCEDVII